ncbi:MAG TPA: S24 family peptidase [Gammaproteobacteria bacterium]|nr:S24 family peptidase [Gammaproteobacteria bacterium]
MPKSTRQWGGPRRNSGRKAGSTKYGEATVVRRLPASWAEALDRALGKRQLLQRSPEIEAIEAANLDSSRLALPLAGGRVAAGFPSAAEDFVEGKLDLNELLVKRPAATFYVKVAGESMRDAGIFPGDLLVVDRGESPRHGHVVVAVVNGELTVKRLYRKGGTVRLEAANPAFPDIEIAGETELTVWGVVRANVHPFL